MNLLLVTSAVKLSSDKSSAVRLQDTKAVDLSTTAAINRPTLQATGIATRTSLSRSSIASETVQAAAAGAATTTVSIHYNPRFSGDEGPATANIHGQEFLVGKPPVHSVLASTVSIPATAKTSVQYSKLLENSKHASYIRNLEPGALKDSESKLRLVQDVGSGAIGKAAAAATQSCMHDAARTGESASQCTTGAQAFVAFAQGAPRHVSPFLPVMCVIGCCCTGQGEPQATLSALCEGLHHVTFWNS